MCDFDGVDIWNNQLLSARAKIVTQTKRLVRVQLSQQPLDADAGIENVFHVPSPSRSARIVGTAKSITPQRLRISSRVRSMRSHAFRIASGSRMPFAALSKAACNSVMSLGGIPVVVSVVLMVLSLPFSVERIVF